MTIYKYPIPVADEPIIAIPRGARILSVDVQHGVPCLWVLVDRFAPEVPHRFRLAGTGHEVDFEWRDAPFVGTVLLAGGALVFHLFDGGEEPNV